MVYRYDLYEAALGVKDEVKVVDEKVDFEEENIFEDRTNKQGLKGGKEKGSTINSISVDQQQPESSKFIIGYGGAWLRPESRKWPWCSWPATTDVTIFTPLLMDPKAVYQPQLVAFDSDDFDGRRVYRITSCYQQGIYFSYTAYNFLGAFSSSTNDKKIDPHWGCNPYTDLSCTPETSGGYELYITRFGNTGKYVNELGIAKAEQGEDDTLGIIMLRIYYALKYIDPWGLVEPPIVEVSDDYGATFTVISQCTEEESLRFNKFMLNVYEFVYPFMPIALNRKLPKGPNRMELFCPLLADLTVQELTSNPAFYPQIVPADQAGLSGYEPFSNPDSGYLYLCNVYADLFLNPKKLENFQENYVILGIVNGFALPVADGLYHGNRVADEDSYDIRYTSQESADTTLPQPTFMSMSAAELQEYYGPNWDGHYRILLSVDQEEESRRCYQSLKERGQLRYIEAEEDFDLNTSDKDIPFLTFAPDHNMEVEVGTEVFHPMVPTYIFRVQEPKVPVVVDLIHYCEEADEETRKNECFNADWLQNYSKTYPLADTYICDTKTGNGRKLTYEELLDLINGVKYVPFD